MLLSFCKNTQFIIVQKNFYDTVRSDFSDSNNPIVCSIYLHSVSQSIFLFNVLLST